MKALVWKEFSIFIRKRDADWRGYVACITCGVVKHWKEMDAGHFTQGRHNSVLFDERNAHAQCKRCNKYLKSNPRMYDRAMKIRYGQDVIDEIDELNLKDKQFTPAELQILLLHYKELNSKQ